MTEQATERRFMTPDETDRYIDERIERKMRGEHAAPRRSFMQRVGRFVNIVVSLIIFTLLAAVLYYIAAMQYHLPVPLNLAATEQAVFSTSGAGTPGGSPQQQPGGAPAQQPFTSDGAAPWPTLTPEPTEARPTLTLPSVPTPTAGFWNPTEVAQMTATVEAFYKPETLPTAPPAFVDYTKEQCADPEKVAQSWMLQQMCEVK